MTEERTGAFLADAVEPTLVQIRWARRMRVTFLCADRGEAMALETELKERGWRAHATTTVDLKTWRSVDIVRVTGRRAGRPLVE